jgi:hypothetical protein
MSNRNQPPDPEYIVASREINEQIKLIAHNRYPAPYWQRYYDFPRGYMDPERLKQRLAEWLAAPHLMKALEFQHDRRDVANYHAVADSLWENQFPLYLLSNPLVEMLLRTDWPADCSLTDDARPPYEACTLVVPKNQLADSTGACLENVSWSFGIPSDRKHEIHFIIVAGMTNGVGYYGRFLMDHDGRLVIPKESNFKELDSSASDLVTGKEIPNSAVVFPEGNEFLMALLKMVTTLFVYINLDKKKGMQPESLRKCVKGKRPGMPEKNYMHPATIGMSLKPTGFATHGQVHSPFERLRRGHLKWVRYGVGRKEKYRKWIMPCIVRYHQAENQHE